MFDQLCSVLETDPPALNTDDAKELAAQFVDKPRILKTLTSERDQNFLLECDTGQRYVLKVSNPAEGRGALDFQTQTLRYLEQQAPELAVQRVCFSSEGKALESFTANGQQYWARVLTFLDGTPVREHAMTRDMRYQLGHQLARLGEALKECPLPDKLDPILWDLQHAGSLSPWAVDIEDRGIRDICVEYLSTFDEQVLPALRALPAQVIYNDLNPSNALADQNSGEVCGIIDFGDITVGPRILDLAVACAYHVQDSDTCYQWAQELIAGFESVSPVSRSELELLPTLIMGRLVATLVITHWRASRYPENSAYILRNAHQAAAVLKQMQRQQDPSTFIEQTRASIEQSGAGHASAG